MLVHEGHIESGPLWRSQTDMEQCSQSWVWTHVSEAMQFTLVVLGLPPVGVGGLHEYLTEDEVPTCTKQAAQQASRVEAT